MIQRSLRPLPLVPRGAHPVRQSMHFARIRARGGSRQSQPRLRNVNANSRTNVRYRNRLPTQTLETVGQDRGEIDIEPGCEAAAATEARPDRCSKDDGFRYYAIAYLETQVHALALAVGIAALLLERLDECWNIREAVVIRLHVDHVSVSDTSLTCRGGLMLAGSDVCRSMHKAVVICLRMHHVRAAACQRASQSYTRRL